MELDYNEIWKLLVGKIGAKRKSVRSKAAVLLVQLFNGARISEAWEGWNKFIETGARELEVRARKRTKNPAMRKIFIPPEIQSPKRFGKVVSAEAVKVFSKQSLGINSHSLRFAFINNKISSGFSGVEVSKFIRHTKLEEILTYYREREADEKFRAALLGPFKLSSPKKSNLRNISEGNETKV
jgi:hypothetical protein